MADLRSFGEVKASDLKVDVAFAVLSGNSGTPIWLDPTFYTFETRVKSCKNPNDPYDCTTKIIDQSI